MAVGIRPNVELAQVSGPALRPRHRRQRHAADVRPAHLRGRRMREPSRARRTASWRRCSRWRRSAPTTSRSYGIGRYAGSQTSTKLKVTGIDLFSAGDFTGGADTEEIVLADPAGGVYKKLVHQGRQARRRRALRRHRRRRVVLQAAARRPQHRRDPRPPDVRRVEPRRHRPPGPDRARSRWPTTPKSAAATACARARSSRRSRSKGLFTLDDVRKHTKASSSCGSCTGLVEQILMATAGGDYSAPPKKKPLCGCTDRTHQEVRDAIREQHLLSIPDAMRFLEWRTPNGCATCRPALNYYLLSTWPQEATDDPQSRFINERAHANIQKDGTLLGDPAHVGRRDQLVRAAAHRRRRRQVRDPHGEGHRRPAHRPARREESRPARGVARPRHAVGPRVREGAAHGEDLRGQRMVPLRHAGLDRRWARSSSARCGACTRRTR